MKPKWLLFCPQSPATPSSPRVMVWRRMHSAGSLGLDNGLWVLPYSENNIKFLQEIADYLKTQGGTSKVFQADTLDEKTEAEILEGFRKDRAQEYYELKEQNLFFLSEIEKEIKGKNFSFAEYEENEQNLVKLEVWYEKIKARDFLGGDQATDAVEWLEKCRQALQQFASEVSSHEGFNSPGSQE